MTVADIQPLTTSDHDCLAGGSQPSASSTEFFHSRRGLVATTEPDDTFIKAATIMIVDDEPANILVIRKYLQRVGYERFRTTTESREAPQIIRHELPDVVLLDIVMPGLSGFEILQIMRSEPALKHIPVLILTACADVDTKLTALKLGATDFLGKPVEPSELVARIRNALIIKAHHDHLASYSVRLEHEVRLRTEELAASKQAIEAAHQAGKAEIATEVLHNVGNGLHSVNVAASIARNTLQQSKLPLLVKATDLITRNTDNLGEFLAHDQRGKLLPEYLVELAQALAEEQQTAFQEIQSLVKHLDHVKAIVATQQRYAGIAGVAESVSLAALLQDAERLSAISFQQQGIVVVRDFSDLPEIMLEKQKLLQVLVNLLRNAFQAIEEAKPEAGQLTLRIRMNGPDRVCVDVADNGMGIAQENVIKIFSHGFTTKKQGRGFGLHSCANLVKQLGGSLTVHSDGPGKGATFTVELPFKAKVR